MATTKERRRLGRGLALFDLFLQETGDEDLTLNQVRVLLYVALRDAQGEPPESREVAAKLGLSSAGVSRTLAILGSYGRGGRKALGLVESRTDYEDRRRKPLHITRKGSKFIQKVMDSGLLHE